ncbi:branched-chain amino acid ABC transporter permease [Brevibacillus centrosporus]|jgi:branched-chain amino acid transport system permease protein|uniref:Amino acid/amide ABC transporter membrane protein 2, HAAT family n=1 Tax=Brevibacillus centrosporus TaxID=54910 RepID=A0A1I4AGP4_9BACL|nr:branched-chain amino acid ABC transporter permease [Brevibacillus centrosporus]MEC2128057.1 branched-chain amino acid ABC transporter permease [Brevibacillus centrosporus]MED4910638.1 branched-chain amino acid ABC transporter permease [Brevibacillus centrosporus]RNB67577.1 branched-chain amino acid ABC transporter permease [Brevibacillus centrosporus]SFK55207.1 amino acid/amide ABC transporter membrane protein 2, HAAT family [Brevibacillus centrosporus]GED31019.1 branched-chain amino acid A
MKQLTKKWGKSLGIYLALMIIFPFVMPDEYYRSVGIIIGLQAIVAIGLCLVMGLAGQISLGQASFWGIGAYTSAVLTTKFGLTPLVGLVASAIVPAVFAFILGRAIAGLQGYYLAMATLAFGYIVQIGIQEWEPVTGGASGMISIPQVPFFGGSELSMYYLIWGIVTCVLLFSLNLMHSRIGRAFRAIHKSEVAATSMGIDVRKFKLNAFVVSGMFAGISGGLYAHYMGILDPQPFGMHESIKFLTMVVIGGMTSIWGALIGTLVIGFISEGLVMLSEVVPGLQGDVDTIVFGGILVLIVMFMPEGLVPRIRSLYEKAQAKKAAANAEQRVERKAAI